MAFGYKDNSIYLYSSKKGEKIDILKIIDILIENPKLSFEADIKADFIVTEVVLC